ncbi:MAG TPA: membrane protein insertase YidC, partial [Chitinophagaceae bacterium]
MKFDRNTVIGFVLLALLFFGFFYFNNQEQARLAKNKAIQDSIAKASQPKPKRDTANNKIDTSQLQTPQITNVTGQFQRAMIGAEQLTPVENELVKVTFTNKGGQIKSVELKKFKDQQDNLVKLASTTFDKIDYKIKGDANQVGNITDFYFTPGNIIKTDSAQIISYTLADSSGRSITHEFVLKKEEYMIDFNVKLQKANSFFDNETMNLLWQYRSLKQEQDMSYERTNSQMGYVMDDEFDYFTIGRRSDVQFSAPVEWVAMRQRFFNGILVAKDKFSGGKMEWVSPNDSITVVQSTASLQHAVRGADVTIPLSVYYGPSDFRILKKYDKQMGKLVNLGQGIYAFVRPINKFIVLPVFDFF